MAVCVVVTSQKTHGAILAILASFGVDSASESLLLVFFGFGSAGREVTVPFRLWRSSRQGQSLEQRDSQHGWSPEASYPSSWSDADLMENDLFGLWGMVEKCLNRLRCVTGCCVCM
jgi:hypothetical protein